jgi:hypothetical protein
MMQLWAGVLLDTSALVNRITWNRMRLGYPRHVQQSTLNFKPES